MNCNSMLHVCCQFFQASISLKIIQIKSINNYFYTVYIALIY